MNIFENVVSEEPITLALGQLSYYSITLRRMQSLRAACNYIIINNNQRGSRKRILGLSRCRILYYMCKSSSHIKLVVVIRITFFFLFCAVVRRPGIIYYEIHYSQSTVVCGDFFIHFFFSFSGHSRTRIVYAVKFLFSPTPDDPSRSFIILLL